MRLAYLTLQSTKEGQAGYTHVHEIVNGLRKFGWNVELFEPYYNKNSSTLFKRFWEFIIQQVKVMKTLKKDDILYVRGHYATFPTVLFASIRKIPIVFEVNGPYDDLFIAWPWTRYFKLLFKLLFKTQFKLANVIITVTPQLREWILQEIKSYNKDKVYVIPNGANVELFNPNAELKYDIEKPYVVFVGALAPWQGIDLMLEAVNDSDWPKNVKLVIVGDGIKRKTVEESAKKNSLVVYLGQIPYRNVPGVIANSIAALSPQNLKRSETGLSPVKLYEYLACGVPVIVTNFPYLSDIVEQNKCGMVIPPQDPKTLAKAVKYLYENETQRKEMGKIGRELIVKHHSWEKRAEDTHDVLIGILKTNI